MYNLAYNAPVAELAYAYGLGPYPARVAGSNPARRTMNKLPKSLKKYIRKEKARIRREIFNKKEREEKLQALFRLLTSKKEKMPEKEQIVAQVSM